MNTYRTKGGYVFQHEVREVPQRDGTLVRWHDVWATITPRGTEQATLSFGRDLVLEMAAWLRTEGVQPNFRIIVGWDKAVREKQGQIFKIFQPVEALDFVLSCATSADYKAALPQAFAPLPGWQKDVFGKLKNKD